MHVETAGRLRVAVRHATLPTISMPTSATAAASAAGRTQQPCPGCRQRNDRRQHRLRPGHGARPGRCPYAARRAGGNRDFQRLRPSHAAVSKPGVGPRMEARPIRRDGGSHWPGPTSVTKPVGPRKGTLGPSLAKRTCDRPSRRRTQIQPSVLAQPKHRRPRRGDR